MTREDKMLLIKDLSSRLPYAVHIQHTSGFSGILHDISIRHKYDGNDNIYDAICYTDFLGDGDSIAIEHFKPYLFPLSSMTSEQLFEVQEIMGKNEIEIEDGFFNIIDSIRNTITYLEILAVLEWFYKNHFDINGLIEKGLAIDATGLNIY